MEKHNLIYKPFKLFTIIILALAFAFFFPLMTKAAEDEGPSLSGSLMNDVYMYPNRTQTAAINYSSKLTLNYSFDSFTLESVTKMSDTADTTQFAGQSFFLEGRLGVLDISSDVVFDPQNKRLDYWLSETSLTFAGATITSTFLLQYYIWQLKPGIKIDTGEFGTGLELSISGELPGGGSTEITSLFGMVKDEYEVLGLQSGSGYDLTTTGPGETEPERRFSYGPSDLQYVSTTAKFYGLDFGCCQLDNETKLSRANGFEYTEFDFTIDAKDFPLTFDSTLRFTPQTKSITLDPYIEVSGDCFTTYVDLAMSDFTIDQMVIEGFGLSDVKLGNATFSSITALKGNLYKNPGASDLDLQADDYIISPDTPDIYTETDYDEVASISFSPDNTDKYPNSSFGADIYFDMDSEGSEYFDLSLFTADVTTRMSSELDIGMGASITPGGDVEAMFEFDVYF